MPNTDITQLLISLASRGILIVNTKGVHDYLVRNPNLIDITEMACMEAVRKFPPVILELSAFTIPPDTTSPPPSLYIRMHYAADSLTAVAQEIDDFHQLIHGNPDHRGLEFSFSTRKPKQIANLKSN
jgi:hypothetical protein